MANIVYNNRIVGELLIDPVGTNMGIQWTDGCDSEIKAKVWNKFSIEHVTGKLIENKDIIYNNL